jgi:hypothetical protein
MTRETGVERTMERSSTEGWGSGHQGVSVADVRSAAHWRRGSVTTVRPGLRTVVRGFLVVTRQSPDRDLTRHPSTSGQQRPIISCSDILQLLEAGMTSTERAPRLLVCTDTYPPQVNGVSVVTALSVAGLARRGWQVAVVAPRYPTDPHDAFGSSADLLGATELLALPSVPLPLYPDVRLSLPNGGALARLLDRFRPDLVHCATEFALGWLGQRAALRRGLPVVSSYHTDFSRYAEAYGMGWLQPAVRRHIGRFHRRSRRTYTPSAPARADLLAMGVGDVEVWGRGVEVETFHPRHRSEPLRAAYGGATR